MTIAVSLGNESKLPNNKKRRRKKKWWSIVYIQKYKNQKDAESLKGPFRNKNFLSMGLNLYSSIVYVFMYI